MKEIYICRLHSGRDIKYEKQRYVLAENEDDARNVFLREIHWPEMGHELCKSFTSVKKPWAAEWQGIRGREENAK